MSKYKGFRPDWEHEPPKPGSFRSILKWGDPATFKLPNERLYSVLKETFSLTDADFTRKVAEGNEPVPDRLPFSLDIPIIKRLREIAGAENVTTAAYPRLAVAYGKTMWDAYRLREGIIENAPDVVVFPASKEQIEEIVSLCAERKVPLYVYGGGSSVTQGVEAVAGGITLDLRKHFTRVIEFSEVNQTITVQSGISGPDLEAALNDAPARFGASRAYTCGHFPQSFEYSAVGGWVVTRGAGQNSTYYGNIKDLVLKQEYATPRGPIASYGLPAHAVGPDIDEIMMGSEGAFGVLTHVTLKVFRYMPANRRKFAFVFPSWEKGMAAAREILQREAGFPSVFRLSDPEETDVMLKMYHVEGTPLDTLMNLFGYKQGRRCLFLGWTEGERGFARHLKRVVKRVSRAHGGLGLTGYPTTRWEHGRFTDPYLREALHDYGIIIDTMECAVTWEMMPRVHDGVRRFAKSRPGTICMTHLSHAYPQGANLYFIFIGKFADKHEYREYQFGIFDNIRHYGASMSHHHGVGKMTAPWVEDSIGPEAMSLFRALKIHFDPDNLMNPGGTLGLDLAAKEKRRARFAGRRWDDPAE